MHLIKVIFLATIQGIHFSVSIDFITLKKKLATTVPYEMGNDFNKPFKLNFTRDTIVDALRRTKNELKEEIGLEFIHEGQLVAAFTNVEKHIKFLLKQPGVQGAIQFPHNTMVVYDYLDEFGYLAWSSLYSGETSIQLKLVEPNNLLSLVLKLGR